MNNEVKHLTSEQVPVVLWGTGSLCKRFLETQLNLPVAFVTSSDCTESSKVFGCDLHSPDTLFAQPQLRLFICSSWVTEIVEHCLSRQFPRENIYVVQTRTLEVVPLSQHLHLSTGEYYYVPWQQQIPALSHSVSGDIVYPDVYKTLAQSVAYCFVSSVEGDFAEFGTCSGYTASLISWAVSGFVDKLKEHEQVHGSNGRKLRLFDSFEGFPESSLEADLQSPHVKSGAWGAGTAKGLNATQLKALCSEYLNETDIQLYEGWYKDTLPTIEPSTRFAFVHIDCDLYESTIDVLQHLFSENHLSEGAILLFDNWYCNRGSQDYGEQKAWQEIQRCFSINASDLGMYGCVGHRKIIHNYKRIQE